MKGTAPRGPTIEADEEHAQGLRESVKEKAENLMIVDMIRNDLGRIAQPGTVQVTKLFEIERHPGVLQMTSTVVAESSGTVSEVFQSLFPCASIVGAPKISTQRILAEIEPSPRGVYTGAIGFILPSGDAQFSVAIRTAVRDYATDEVEYGVGGGIVWDSEVEKEWRECLLKAQPLSHQSAPWALIETLLWDGQYYLLDRHLLRMARSARELGVPFDQDQALATLTAATSDASQALRVRLQLNREGRFLATTSPYVRTTEALRIDFAPRSVHAKDPSLRHKTNRRWTYDHLRRTRMDCDDLVLFNENEEVTEFLIGNLVARISGEYLTPPLSSGLLPGVFREELLETGEIREAIITIADLRDSPEVVRFNSVSGWCPCNWVA
jgi:para-aminobenzoate synthetase/4-amino-4-deoxychorismate lyase